MNSGVAAGLALVGYPIGSNSFAGMVGRRVVPDADLTGGCRNLGRKPVTGRHACRRAQRLLLQ